MNIDGFVLFKEGYGTWTLVSRQGYSGGGSFYFKMHGWCTTAIYVTPQGNFKKYRETNNRAYKHSLLKTEFVGKIKILLVSEMKH